jgi:predicted nucleic acid-binding protein
VGQIPPPLIIDTNGLLSLVEPDLERRTLVLEVLKNEPRAPVLSTFVAAELDYFLQKLLGKQGNRALIDDLAAGRFELPCFEPTDFAEIQGLNDRYRELSPGIADLSIVVLAARYRTTRLLTFDQRHFRLLRPLQGGAFTLLPFDDDVT